MMTTMEDMKLSFANDEDPNILNFNQILLSA